MSDWIFWYSIWLKACFWLAKKRVWYVVCCGNKLKRKSSVWWLPASRFLTSSGDLSCTHSALPHHQCQCSHQIWDAVPGRWTGCFHDDCDGVCSQGHGTANLCFLARLRSSHRYPVEPHIMPNRRVWPLALFKPRLLVYIKRMFPPNFSFFSAITSQYVPSLEETWTCVRSCEPSSSLEIDESIPWPRLSTRPSSLKTSQIACLRKSKSRLHHRPTLTTISDVQDENHSKKYRNSGDFPVRTAAMCSHFKPQVCLSSMLSPITHGHQSGNPRMTYGPWKYL